MQLLVIEDESKIARSIGVAFEAEGFAVRLCSSGEDGFFAASTEQFDAIVLDRMLPGRDGMEVLQALRAAGCRTPVVMLTALGEVEDRVDGLKSGADDYLVKPFAMNELIARVRALLRRGVETAQREVVQGTLRLDLLARRATISGRSVTLTSTEWDLLCLLASSPGAAVSRDTIAHRLWPDQARNTSLDNLIDVHVGRLRRKLDTGSQGPRIETIRGLGFRLRDAA